MSTRYTPEPSQIDYHSEIQERRVAQARKLIDAGDVVWLRKSVGHTRARYEFANEFSSRRGPNI